MVKPTVKELGRNLGMKVNKVRIKLNDNGKGSIAIGDDETEITLAATMGVQVIGRANHLTHVTIRMLADVEFEGSAELTLEQARELWPELYLTLHGD